MWTSLADPQDPIIIVVVIVVVVVIVIIILTCANVRTCGLHWQIRKILL